MYENKKIFILGFARSGYEAAKVLIARGNQVLINDKKEESEQDSDKVKELRELGVNFVFGSHPPELLDESFDYLVKNPGVPLDHIYVKKAQELQIPIVNEVEIAFSLFPKGVKLIGITGTNGKTTTTTLTYEFLKEAGLPVYLTGNIGFPLCGFVNNLKSGDIVVMEVSCQQLVNLTTFRPDIALMTNLSPAHLDFLGDYDNYKRVKKKIFQNQKSSDIAILNMEDEDILNLTKDIKATVKYFSSKHEINGAYLKNDVIYYYDEQVVSCRDIMLKGVHNLENIMGAIMIAKEFAVSNDVILKVLHHFNGVAHRLEFVRDYQGKRFYNDSKATNLKSTQIALSAFTEPTILLLGGQERHQDFNDLKPYLQHVKAVICFGEVKDRAALFVKEQGIPVYVEDLIPDCVKLADELAVSGDVVVLSPGSGSWDHYKKFEDRGDEFKKYVNLLGDEMNEN